jgi:capsular polysaccharide biosynthesis protein
MNSRITVPLPLNITGETAPLFEPYQAYELSPQRVKRFNNVFVANSGFCLNRKGLIKECHHKHPHQYADYQNEVAGYYYDATDHPENLVTLDDERIYLTIHHPWFNYYHWICESIFRLWLVRDETDDLVLVLPEYYKDADFIMGSLEPFNIKHMFFIPNGKSLLVKNLCLPQIKAVCDSYNAKQLKQVSEFYRNYVFREKKISVDKIEKLYVSRHFASRRKVINEAEILTVLERYGFTIFYPEHFPFLQQVAIFAGVKYLVGEHGSGLTNLLFMQKGASVLELHKSKINDFDHPSPLFWYMAHALQINYYHQVCETYGKEDYFEGDYMVDVGLFEQNLALMLSVK